MLSTRDSITASLWFVLFLCCIGVPIAVVAGLLLRRSFLWWCASTMTVLAILLSISIAVLDKLGFK